MRLLIDLQALQRPNRFDPWRNCLERLLPALIEAAPAQGMTPHLLLNAAWPQTLPPLYRRFGDLYRNGQIHSFHGVATGDAPSPACLQLQALAIAGLAPDLVLHPGGPNEGDTGKWLAGLLPDGLPLHDVYAAKSYEKIKFFNALAHQHESAVPSRALGLPRPYVLCIGPAGAAGQRPMTDLIAAFAALPRAQQQAWDLVLAGQFTAAERQALIRCGDTHGLPERHLRILHDLTTGASAALIAEAGLVVDLTTQNALNGVTLDASAAGVPVLAADTSLHRGLLGGAEGLFDPAGADALTETLGGLLTQPQALSGLAQGQTARGKAVDWPGSAAHLLRCIAVAEGVAANKHAAPAPTWEAEQVRLDALEAQAITALQDLTAEASGTTLAHIARALLRTRITVENALRGPACALTDPARGWRLEGPFDSSYSLASVNRETARALARVGWSVAIFNAEGHGPYAPDETYLEGHPDLTPLRAAADTLSDTQAFVTSRNMYPPRCDDMRSRLNLLHGYAWEETGFPTDYVRDINTHLQGLLVTTPHVKRLLINAGITPPITVVGNGVDHIDGPAAALPFALPDAKFRILHVSSCMARKGPDVLLAAFVAAFAGDPVAAREVCLVIKTTDNPHHSIREDIAALQKAHPVLPQMVVETGDLDTAQMRGLFEAADLLVAPSRAEGYCLPIAEAVLAGTPVLATGWSGQMVFDGNPMVRFIDYEFAMAASHLGTSQSVWAEPSAAHLARLMRAARVNPPSAAEVQTGAEMIRAIHTWDTVARESNAAVERLIRARPNPPPRIGWVSTFNTRCGIATYSAHLLRALPYQVTVLADHSDDLQQPDDQNLRRCWVQGKEDPLEELRAMIARENLQTIVIQFNYGFYNFAALGRLILWLKATGRQVVLMMHGTDDTPHLPENRIAGLRAELALCDRLLVHSVHDLNRLKALGLVDNVALFPHGVPDAPPMPAPDLTPDRPFVLGTYGFLLPHKGYPELIDALALLRAEGRDVTLRMVNAQYPAPVSAELASALRDRIAEQGLGAHVDLCTGFLEDADSFQRLSEADLLVFPHRPTTESASGAVRQALAVSRPIATTPLPIFDDVSGLTVPLPGFSPAEMAAGLGQMIDEMRAGSPDGAVAHSRAQADHWRQVTGYRPLAARLWAMLCALHADQTL